LPSKVLVHRTWNYNVFKKYLVGKWALVPSVEREVKEAKADILRLSAEGLLMKETMAAFQKGTNEALETMVANHQELIAGLKVRDNNIWTALDTRDDRLDRHSKKIGGESVKVLSAFAGLCNS
jgi:hypothetical protein